jgi:hypothetical protein
MSVRSASRIDDLAEWRAAREPRLCRYGRCTGCSNDNAADQAANCLKVWDSPGDGPPSDFRPIDSGWFGLLPMSVRQPGARQISVALTIPENRGRQGKARTRYRPQPTETAASQPVKPGFRGILRSNSSSANSTQEAPEALQVELLQRSVPTDRSPDQLTFIGARLTDGTIKRTIAPPKSA